jgi:hypothetical protein
MRLEVYRKRLFRIGLLVLLLATPTAAHANVGIPMLAYAWPAAWVVLLPVIALEALVARRIFRSDWPSSFKVAGLSNFISTLAGIPIAWVAVLLLGSLVHFFASLLPRAVGVWVHMPFYAAWLPPYRDSPPWLIPAAGAVLCVPFFIASVWIERRVAQRFVGFHSTDVRRWAWRANLASYSLIAAGLIILALVIGLRQ